MSDTNPKPCPARRRTARIIVAAVAAVVLFVGYQYWLTSNFRPVVPGVAYRSGQPRPAQLARWCDRYGIRTVINLRGFAKHDSPAEQAAAAELDLKYLPIYDFSAHTLPPQPRLAELIDAVENAPRPILIHCYHGNDRSGVASVIAAMALGGQTYAQAVSQARTLRWPWDRGTVRVQDVLAQYEAYCRNEYFDTAGWDQFRTWALEVYHPHFYWVDIDGPTELTAAPGASVAVPLTITNRADEPIPGSDPAHQFYVIAYAGPAIYNKQDGVLLGEPHRLPTEDLAPGHTWQATIDLTTPTTPGTYACFIDLLDDERTTFARMGSDPLALTLHVTAAASVPATGP